MCWYTRAFYYICVRQIEQQKRLCVTLLYFTHNCNCSPFEYLLVVKKKSKVLSFKAVLLFGIWILLVLLGIENKDLLVFSALYCTFYYCENS